MDHATAVSQICTIRVLADIPRYQAALRPNDVALNFNGRETTYEQLDERTNRVANGLMSVGMKQDRRVAILDKNSDLYFEVMFGAVKANLVLGPVNARLAPPEIVYIVNDAHAEVLFVGEEYREAIHQIRDQLPGVRKIIILNSEFESWRDEQEATDPNLPISPDDVCMQMYTSGTTGRPKGAQLSNANFTLAEPEMLEVWAEWSSSDVLIMAMPLFHIAGYGTGVLGLLGGLKTVICRDFSARDTLQLIEQHQISVGFFVPSMLLAMLNEPDVGRFDVSSLRSVIYGASPIPVELMRTALRVFKYTFFVQVYGLTETTGVITVLPPEDHMAADPETLKSCGRAIAGVEIKIVDGSGKQAPVREVGEVACRTVKITKGYWNRLEDTAAAIREGWFYTGDAGYLNEKGYLFIHDRVKDMIVSGGENIYPAEIESALFGHPDIAGIAVIGVPDSRRGEAVKALIVLRQGCVPEPSAILAYARERLAGYKVPRSIDFISEMPRNASGKILKRTLREQYWRGYERRVN